MWQSMMVEYNKTFHTNFSTMLGCIKGWISLFVSCCHMPLYKSKVFLTHTKSSKAPKKRGKKNAHVSKCDLPMRLTCDLPVCRIYFHNVHGRQHAHILEEVVQVHLTVSCAYHQRNGSKHGER